METTTTVLRQMPPHPPPSSRTSDHPDPLPEADLVWLHRDVTINKSHRRLPLMSRDVTSDHVYRCRPRNLSNNQRLKGRTQQWKSLAQHDDGRQLIQKPKEHNTNTSQRPRPRAAVRRRRTKVPQRISWLYISRTQERKSPPKNSRRKMWPCGTRRTN